MTAKDVELAIAKHFNYRMNMIIPNVSWGIPGINHECDLLILSKAGYLREVEIKVSRSDIKADLDKRHHHKSKYIRELYFAVPEELADCEYLPKDAGLITVGKWSRCTVVRRTITNKDALKLPDSQVQHLLHLGCMRIWTLKSRLWEANQTINKYRKEKK